MQTITTQVFFPAVERALVAVGGHYDLHEPDAASLPPQTWRAFLNRLQEELGPEWGPIEQRAGTFATPHVAVPYVGSEAPRRRLPIIFRHDLVAVEGTPMLQLRFNVRTL